MVPYPIIKIDPGAARTKLIADLYALGWRRDNLPPDKIEGTFSAHTHLYLSDSSHMSICRVRLEPDEMHVLSNTRYWGDGTTKKLVNSPAHMLAYLRHHGIKPRVQ